MRSFLLDRLLAPARAWVHDQVRHAAASAVDEAFAAAPPADARAVRSVADRVAPLAGTVEALRDEVAACRAAVAALEDRAPDDDAELRVVGIEGREAELAARVEGVAARVQAASDRLVGLQRALETAEARLREVDALLADLPRAGTRPPTPVPDPLPATPAPEPARLSPATCGVPGCDSPVRAKGLCGKHYQLWRRGNLPGFPPPA